jgi:hypothetical protein
MRMAARAGRRLLAGTHPAKAAAAIAVAGLISYIAFSTSYTPRHSPRYRGDHDETTSVYRLAGIDSIDRFTLAPDGRSLNFLCRRDGRWILWTDGQGWGQVTCRYNDSSGGRPDIRLSPDGSRIGIVYQRASSWRDSGPRPAGDGSNGQWFVSIDRRIFGGFDRDFKPAVHFSPDGAKFAFPYKRSGQYYVQVVDTTFGPYDRADMTITKDGEIVLGYVKQDRAYIEMVYSPKRTP